MTKCLFKIFKMSFNDNDITILYCNGYLHFHENRMRKHFAIFTKPQIYIPYID